jgi:hypothetical protein
LLCPIEVVVTTPPPPPPPVSKVQVLVAVQKYKFAPAAAFDRKNIWPMVQVDGKIVPTFVGLVAVAPEKSMFFV